MTAKKDVGKMQALEARVLVVMDKAVASGNAELGGLVNAVLDYLRDPSSDVSSAAALVASLERKANGGKAPGKKAPVVTVTPGTLDAAASKEPKAGSFGGFGWWSTLSDTQRAVYGVGTVALLVLAFKLWSDR